MIQFISDPMKDYLKHKLILFSIIMCGKLLDLSFYAH